MPSNVSYSENTMTISSFDSLPIDVVANILQRLPAQFLYSCVRYVCKTWAEILSLHCFIKSQLLHSQCGFLIQDAETPYNVQMHYINARDLEIIKETHTMNLNFPGKIRGSSDGVLLINKSSHFMSIIYVANPITNMKLIKLPSLPLNCMLSNQCNNIARISATGEIKVVSLGKDSNGLYGWYVLTVGKVMSWRKIKRVPLEYDPALYLSCVQSLSIDGFIYWTNSSWITDQSVLAIDLYEETAYLVKVPIECDGQYWTLVQLEKEVCCMNCGKNVEMKVWKLKDFHKNEWIVVNIIKFPIESLLRSKFCMPLIWLDSKVLVISVYVEARNVLVAYHVEKDEHRVIKIGDVARHAIFLHTNSLVQI